LTEPRNALTKQYVALIQTEGIKIQFTDDSIEEVASIAADVNEKTENIGARRLHTVLKDGKLKIDSKYVKEKLRDIVKDEDLSRYIL
jgi:ATP-dependent HslUV protease ATP-binding subunit HslU